MFCGKCGAQNPDNAAFCKNCGARLSENAKAPASTAVRTSKNVQRGGVKKRRPILTTKKTTTPYLVFNVLSDAIINFGLSCFFFIRADEMIASYWYRSEGETLQVAGFMFLIIGMLSMSYHAMISRTYVDVFQTRLSGSGMQGIQCKSFELRFDQIYGISVSKGFMNMEANVGSFLIINTAVGNYKILTTDARAKEIVEYYSRTVNQRRTRRES